MSHKNTNKLKPISQAAKMVGNHAFRRYGFAQREIVSRWPDIVGPALAECSLPERLTFPQNDKSGGTLYIRVQGSMAPEIQHFEPLVIERINGYYGYQAVKRLSFRHGPVPLRPRKKPRQSLELPESQKKWLEEQLGGVKNPELYQALYRLGSEVGNVEKPEKIKEQCRFMRRGMGSKMPK